MPIDAPSTDNGKIRDSNKIMLMSALQDLDIPFVVDGGTAKDEFVVDSGIYAGKTNNFLLK